MPVSKTLAELRTLCRRRTDFENSSFITPAEWDEAINASGARLHSLLTHKLGGEYVREETLRSTTANQSYVELTTSLNPVASNVYKLEGVEVLVGNNYVPLTGVKWQDRARFGSTSSRGRPTHYARSNFRRAVPRLELFPTPGAVYTIRVIYVPNFTPLVADDDELVLPEDWFDWIACDVAITAVIKEEGSMYRALSAERDKVERLIDMAASDIDHDHALDWSDEEGLNDTMRGGWPRDESDWDVTP